MITTSQMMHLAAQICGMARGLKVELYRDPVRRHGLGMNLDFAVAMNPERVREIAVDARDRVEIVAGEELVAVHVYFRRREDVIYMHEKTGHLTDPLQVPPVPSC